MLEPPSTCQACGRPFIAARPWQRFCSPACQDRAKKRRVRGQNAGTSPTTEWRDSGSAVSQHAGPASEGVDAVPVAPLGSKKGRIIANAEFHWAGLALHFCKRKKPVLTLAADDQYAHLFRIFYPEGWISTPANLTRAKDAAYGHARWLLSHELEDAAA